MSAKMAYPGLLKIKVFRNKGYDIITYIHHVNDKILSRDLNYTIDVVMWLKFDNTSISMREVIIISILQGFDQKNCIFWEVVLVHVQKFGTGTRYELETLHQCSKKVKTKSQKFLGASSYFCRSYRGKTGKGGAFLFLPSPILNRVKGCLWVNKTDICRFMDPNNIHVVPFSGSISKDFAKDGMKECAWNGIVYEFLVDCNVIQIKILPNSYDYLIKVHKYEIIFTFIELVLVKLFKLLTPQDIKWTFLHNELRLAIHLPFDLTSDELCYYPFAGRLDRCRVTYNTLNDLFNRLRIWRKT